MSAEAFRDSSCQSTRYSVQGNGQYGAQEEKQFSSIFKCFIREIHVMRDNTVCEGISELQVYASADNGALISVCSANANHCGEYLHEPLHS